MTAYKTMLKVFLKITVVTILKADNFFSSNFNIKLFFYLDTETSILEHNCEIILNKKPSTYMLVFAADVSQSAANPTMSNPVESWLKYLGCPA